MDASFQNLAKVSILLDKKKRRNNIWAEGIDFKSHLDGWKKDFVSQRVGKGV